MEKPVTGVDGAYSLQYYGQTLIHSYYTDPMLPWIIQEIVLPQKVNHVYLTLSTSGVSVTGDGSIPKKLSESDVSTCTIEDKLSKDLILFEDEEEVKEGEEATDPSTDTKHKMHFFHCKYTDVIHVRKVYCRQSSYLIILVRETKESPIFCHAFKATDQNTTTMICNAIEEKILQESKNGSSCSFSKLGGGEGSGSAYSDCMHFEVLLLGVVNMHNPDPAHTLIDEAVTQFNEKYSKLEHHHHHHPHHHTTEERGNRTRPSPISRELFSNFFNNSDMKIGSPPSSFMDDSREGSLQMLREMRQRCNSVEHAERPQSVRKRTRHRSEPSSYAHSLQCSRIRLFQIGRDSIKLICPNKSNRTCEIEFSDISRCMQGIKYKDHFGIIANKIEFLSSKQTQGNSKHGDSGHNASNHQTHSEKKIVCYVFKCAEDYVCEEIMQAIKQAFTSCATNASPMREYDMICKDINAVSSHEALAIVKHKMKKLTDNEMKCIKAQVLEINPASQEDKLSALMAALRQLYEVKHVEHMMKIKTSQQFAHQHSQPIPMTKALDNIKSRAMNSFGNLLQKGRRKMQELQHDAEQFSGQLTERNPSSPAQKFKFLSDTFSSSAPNTPQKDASNNNNKKYAGVSRSSPDSDEGIRRRSISLGSRPSSMHQIKKTNPPQTLFYHKIFQSITSTGPSSSSSSQQLSQSAQLTMQPMFPENHKRYDTPEDIRQAWKWAIKQQILLNKINSIKTTNITTAEGSSISQSEYAEMTPVPSEMQAIWDDLFAMSLDERERIEEKVLRAAVQRGLLCHSRGRIWKLLRNHCQYGNAGINKSEYTTESYLRLLENLTPYQHAILIDIGRTFPTHPMYCQQLGPGQLSLFNVLKAYSLNDEEVGYCQGLSFIAGILLMHTCVENEAYELLYCLMYEVGCRSMYLPDMKGMKLAIYKMARLLHDMDIELFEFFETREVSMMLVATPWFLTMFASTFPISFVTRVFDMVFLEGTSALFKIAICLLQENRRKIFECEDFEDVVNFIRTEVPESSTDSLSAVINEAMVMDVGFKLREYEVEYRILQDEVPLQRKNTEKLTQLEEQIQCLENVNRTVTESNCGLLKQLHEAQQKVAFLQRQLRDVGKNH